MELIDILLVDDLPENLVALAGVLKQPDYNLVNATSGNEALRYLLDHCPALILMDVQMPGMDGLETAALIKHNPRTREIPIIFVTAIDLGEQNIRQGYDHGAVDYIHKPYDPHILRSKVAVFAQLTRQTRRLLKAEMKLRANERRHRERQIAYLELKHLKREQAEQQRYRDLLEGVTHAIVWSVSPESLTIDFVSRSAETILGYPLDQWLSEPDFLTLHSHADDRQRLLGLFAAARDSKKELNLEHRFLTPDGRTVWLNTGVRRAYRGAGPEQELRGLSVDVTRLKEAEIILKTNKNRSDFLAEASLLLAESLDYETTLARVARLAVPGLANSYAIDLVDESGKIRPLVSAQNETLNSDFSRALADTARNVLKTGKAQFYTNASDGANPAIVLPLIAREKILGIFTLSAGIAGRYDDNDLLMAKDLARRAAVAIDNANLYRQAQTAIRTRDEFLSIASHELKTPLTPLKLQTQLLQRTLNAGGLEKLNPERVVRMLDISNKQITRLTRLIDELLDISRINMGKLNLQLEDFNLVELLEDVVERFCGGPLAETKCQLTVQPGMPRLVHWDRFRIEQVVINLLTNAIKYGAGKPVEISLQQQDAAIVMTFRDEGIGIAIEDQKRIFERFERAASGSHYAGLGLGLYIVTQILRCHGGTIEVNSEPGKGALFTVKISIQLPIITETGNPAA
ncbi:MAG: response regulator [Deltaproteobacteria bacterium]|nr:response regulator [Deltaproteobacteria bacterium]